MSHFVVYYNFVFDAFIVLVKLSVFANDW